MTIAVITPADFDPTDSDVKRPLLCVIHGGPTGTDMPSLPDRNYYPIEHWDGSVSRRSLLASGLHSSKECQQ